MESSGPNSMPDDPTPRAAALKCEKTHDPIAKFWNAHDPSGSMFEECKKLGKIMFFKCNKNCVGKVCAATIEGRIRIET